MSYTHEDDWIHVDDWEKQVRQYEAEIEDLKLQVKNALEDEAYILSELIRLRNLAFNEGEGMSEEALEVLISRFQDPEVKALAAGWVESTK